MQTQIAVNLFNELRQNTKSSFAKLISIINTYRTAPQNQPYWHEGIMIYATYCRLVMKYHKSADSPSKSKFEILLKAIDPTRERCPSLAEYKPRLQSTILDYLYDPSVQELAIRDSHSATILWVYLIAVVEVSLGRAAPDLGRVSANLGTKYPADLATIIDFYRTSFEAVKLDLHKSISALPPAPAVIPSPRALHLQAKLSSPILQSDAARIRPSDLLTDALFDSVPPPCSAAAGATSSPHNLDEDDASDSRPSEYQAIGASPAPTNSQVELTRRMAKLGKALWNTQA